MDWLALHKTSEALAARAHAALRDGSSDDAEELFRQAAAAEEDALAQLDTSKPRTFGIAAVSAVSLWYKGKNVQRASMLAYKCRLYAISCGT